MAKRLLASLGLAFNPFSIAINQGSYYETAATKRIMDMILYGVETRKGLLLLSGEVGVGKSSLLLRLLSRLKGQGVVTALVINSLLDRQELLENICADFGFKLRSGLNTSQLLMVLHSFFLKQFNQGRNCVILVNEAHHLADDVLESLRMLANLETDGVKLVQVVLIAQPELRERLQTRRLRQFASRINIAADLPALSRAETAGYVEFKLAQAGSQIRPSVKAMDLLWKTTTGNTRFVNLLMERCLYAMVARGRDVIDDRVMKAAVADLDKCQGGIGHGAAPGRTMLQGLSGRLGVAALLVLLFAAALSLGMQLDQGRLSGADGLQGHMPSTRQAQARTAEDYILSVDLTRHPETARLKADDLQQIGFDACVLRLDTDQGTFYSVQIGQAQTPEQAQTIRNNYRRHFPDTVYLEHFAQENSARKLTPCTP